MRHRQFAGVTLVTNLASVHRFDELDVKVQNGRGTVYEPDGELLKEDLYKFDVSTVISAKVKAMLASTAPRESSPMA